MAYLWFRDQDDIWSAMPLNGARRVEFRELTELAREDVAAVLGHLRETLAAHHRVAIDAPMVEEAVARSLTLTGPVT